MDEIRFDRLARSISAGSSRRALLFLAFAALGLAAARPPSTLEAKRKKPKKPALNAFGCLNVGQPCRGKDALCCSGVCQGKKPRKGKKDKSRCVDHDAGSCLPNQDTCVAMTPPCGVGAACFRTTGNGSFCGLGGGAMCADCAKDSDCEPAFGPGAACVICPPPCLLEPHTACIPPAS